MWCPNALPFQALLLLIGVCVAPCAAADNGDDFSNNLFSDLAPLLTLFGERVTMQFMSQSTGWADNIILAMAPLGIITAIVGAIRVGGPSWLKTIIGRARESRAVTESELMSSTSNEVCEMWNGQQIVRVMGSGPIREFIIMSVEQSGAQTTAKAASGMSATGEAESGSVSGQAQPQPPQSAEATSTVGFERDSVTPSGNSIAQMMADTMSNQSATEDAGSNSAIPDGDISAEQPTDVSTSNQNATSEATQSQSPIPIQVMNLNSKRSGQYINRYDSTIQERIFGKLIWGSAPTQERHERSIPVRRRGRAPNIQSLRTIIRERFSRKGSQRDPEIGQFNSDPQEISSNSETPKPNESPSLETRKTPIAIVRNTKADAPNLTFNVHSQIARGELYIVAFIGVLIQLGALIYFGIAAKYLKLLKDGRPIKNYAFPCTATGTLLLVAGVFICAHIVESSTSEIRYRPKDKMEARVVWLQRSGIVNDQAFNSFAIFPEDVQALVTTSHRAERRKLKDISLLKAIPLLKAISHPWLRQNDTGPTRTEDKQQLQQKSTIWDRLWGSEVEEVVTVAGMLLSIFGFVMQFIGLRGMHWSSSVVQLGAIVIMTILRAWVRRNLAKNPKSRSILPGYELDWLAMVLVGEPELYTQIHIQEDDKNTPTGPPWKWNVSPIQDMEKCEYSVSGFDHNDPEIQSPSTAQRAMKLRRDLGELAGWHGLASAEAISLARAIEIVMNTLLPDHTGIFTWSLQLNSEQVYFPLQQDQSGAWRAQSDMLESALSLWLYSIEKEEKDSDKGPRDGKSENTDGTQAEGGSEGGSENGNTPVPGRVEEDKTDDTWLRAKGTPARRNLRLLDSYKPVLLQNLEWWMPDGAARVIPVEKVQDLAANNSIIIAGAHRVSGCLSESCHGVGPHVYRERKQTEVGFFGDDWRAGSILATESYTPLRSFFAQHMFSTFMQAVAKMMEKPFPGNTEIHPIEPGNYLAWQSFTLRNSQFSRMVQDIQSTGLGSQEEIYLNIIPPLSTQGKLPHVDSIIEWARKSAEPYERRAHWSGAVDAYLWLFNTAKMFPRNRSLNTKALALLMECLRRVSDRMKLWEDQMVWMEKLEEISSLEQMLRNKVREATAGAAFSALVRLYQFQRRPLERSFVKTLNLPRNDDNLQLGLTNDDNLQLELTDDDSLQLEHTDDDSLLGRTSLHWLASSKTSGDIAKVIKSGRRVGNEKDIHDWTPLHYATVYYSHYTSDIEALLKNRVDANAQDIRGRTPLHYACQHQLKDIVSALGNATEINIQDRDGITPLHDAAIHCHGSNLARSLIEAGANIDAADSSGNTALHWCAYMGHESLIKHLWRDSTTRLRNHDGRTALHLAALAGRTAAVHILIMRGSDWKERDGLGDTALHLAARKGRIKVVQRLLKDAAAIVDAEGFFGNTPLHYAAEAGHVKVVRLLLECGANKELGDEHNETPFVLASRSGRIGVVRVLIEYGADVRAPQWGPGLSIPKDAVIESHVHIARLVQEVEDADTKALRKAIKKGRTQLVESLLEKGVYLDAAVEEPILNRAIRKGNKEMVRLLERSIW